MEVRGNIGCCFHGKDTRDAKSMKQAVLLFNRAIFPTPSEGSCKYIVPSQHLGVCVVLIMQEKWGGGV